MSLFQSCYIKSVFGNTVSPCQCKNQACNCRSARRVYAWVKDARTGGKLKGASVRMECDMKETSDVANENGRADLGTFTAGSEVIIILASKHFLLM